MSEIEALPAPVLPKPPQSKWQREYRAFLRLLPELLATHGGRHVAVHEGRVVGSGMPGFSSRRRCGVSTGTSQSTSAWSRPTRRRWNESRRLGWSGATDGPMTARYHCKQCDVEGTGDPGGSTGPAGEPAKWTRSPMTSEQQQQLDEAAYRRLKPSIDRTYPHGRFVAVDGGRVVADAASFRELESALAAGGYDARDVLVVQAGEEMHPETGVIFFTTSGGDVRP